MKAKQRQAFTLFELILAIALSAALLTLIGTAINLYLVRVDADRTRVEEAQLARSILAMITDDLRAATVYQSQDTSAIAQLMAEGTPFDVDSIDEPNQESSGSGDNEAGSGASGTGNMTSSFGSTSSSSSSSSQMSASESMTPDEPEGTLPLGMSGTLGEVYVDVTRLPRQEELFATVTGYTNAPLPMPTGPAASATTAAATVRPPADLKTIRYFVRQGDVVEPGSIAATSLAPDAQMLVGGLVRQEIPRRYRLWAEATGNSALLDSGQALIAPEVVAIEFRYYDGLEVTDVWDMAEKKTLPLAIDVSIWLRSASSADSPNASRYEMANIASSARQYRQTVYLPMSEVSQSSAMGESGGASQSETSGSSSSESSSSESSSNSGSEFGGTP